MRRKDREVAGLSEIETIISKCRICHVAMIDWEGLPYVVPLHFGYEIENGVLHLYFHSAPEGKKIKALRKNEQVCFSLIGEEKLILGERPCDYTARYSSVIGYGTVKFLMDPAEKSRALSLFFQHQTGQNVVFGERETQGVCLFQIVSKEFCGKHNKD